jgi:hypothetical protein
MHQAKTFRSFPRPRDLGGRPSPSNDNLTLVRAAKPANKDLPAGKDVKGGKTPNLHSH